MLMTFTKSTWPLAIGLALVLVTGCASHDNRGSLFGSDDFEMPDSVAEDLEADTGKSETKSEPQTEDQTVQDNASQDGKGQDGTAATASQTADGNADSASAATAAAATTANTSPEAPPHDPEQIQQAQQAQSDFNRALGELRKGNLDSAQTRFQQLSAQYPALGGPVVNQAIALRKQGKLQEAYDLIQANLLQHSKNPHLLNELGVVSRKLGKFRQAQVSYESAIRVDDRFATAHYNLAVLADLYLHDPALALKEFETYQTLIPEPDKQVSGWIIELQRRAASTQ